MNILGFILLPVLFFVYNLGETLLKLNHSSFCESTGCAFAANLLRFDSLYLNYIGVVVAAFIAILGWLAYKNPSFKKFFYLAVFVSLAFETIMLGYQYFAAPMMCKFCMGIWGFLFAIMIASSGRYALMAIPALIAPLLALSFLTIPKTQAYLVSDGRYLIQSPTCPHCKKVKAYFKEHDITFSKLDINDPEAKNFATYLNYGSIPIMIEKKGNHINIIHGDESILKSFEEPQEEASNEVEKTEEKNTSFSIDALPHDEGCGFFDINKIEESCEN